ncbi:phage tail tape measure protein [Halomonas cupida]|uniref:phage tail tape measure protein n=1 Tax=Halomonas cupida TaxID=44933 RepID=UPI003A8F6CA2
MAKPLKLEVLLGAIDKATGPLKKITQGSDKTAQALKASREQLRDLQQQQKDVRGYREAQVAMRRHERALRDLRTDTERYTSAMAEQREKHVALKANLKNAQRQYDKLSKAIINTTEPNKQLSHEFEKARIALTSQHQAFEQSSRAIKQYRERVQRSEQQTESLTRAQRDQQERLNGLKRRLNDAGIGTDSLGRKARELRGDEERLNTTFEEQQARLKAVTTQQRRLTAARDRYQNSIGRASRMAGAGAGGLATGGAALYAGARMLTPGIDYGAQMSAVQAVGRFEKDDPRFQALKDQSRELGASTAFSATDVGAGQEFLLRAGMSAEAIKASMGDVLNLALANNTELGRAADIASNIAGTFKIDMEAEGSMGRVADILSGTASRANVDLEMLGETMKYLGGAEDLKLSMEQAAAMAGMMGNIGIQGSQAGTTMRAMMNRLTEPAKEGADAMASIGLQVADANGNMRAMPDILRDINKATADLGNVERKAILQKIFGAEAGSGMAELVNGMSSGQLDEFIASLGENYGENARMAGTMSDNIRGDLKGLRSAWEEVGITLTDTNEGPLRDLVQKATEVVRAIGVWMNENPELTAQIATAAAGVAGLVAAGGALTLALGSLLGPMVLTRYGLQMIGIKGAGTGKIFGKLGKAARSLGGMLGKVLGGTLSSMLKTFQAVGKAARWLGQMLSGTLFKALSGLWSLGKKALPYLARALGVVSRAILLVSRALLLNPIGLLITILAGGAYLIWKNWDKLSPWFSDLWERIKTTGQTFWEWLKNKAQQAADFVSYLFFNWTLPGLLIQHWDEIKAKASELWQWFQDAPSNAIDAVAKMVEDWNLKDVLKEKWDAAIEYLKSLPSRMRDTGVDLARGLGEGITEGASNAWDAIRNVATETEHIPRYELDTHSPSRVFKSIGGDLMDGLALGIKRDQDNPLGEVTAFSKRMRRAGTGIALGAVTMPAVAALPVNTSINSPVLPAVADVQLDRRPALTSPTPNAQATGDNITINVYGAPGQDTTALTQEINRVLEERDRNKAARRRSSLRDID